MRPAPGTTILFNGFKLFEITKKTSGLRVAFVLLIANQLKKI
jgi:hypothetical protein